MVENEMMYCRQVPYKDRHDPYFCHDVVPQDFMNFVCPYDAWLYLSEYENAIKHFTCCLARAKDRNASRPDFQQDIHDTCCLTRGGKK